MSCGYYSAQDAMCVQLYDTGRGYRIIIRRTDFQLKRFPPTMEHDTRYRRGHFTNDNARAITVIIATRAKHSTVPQ